MGYSHDEWTLLIIQEKMAGNRDAQSHAQIKSKYNCKQNSPRNVVSWTVPVVSDQPWNVLVGGGVGVKILPFCLVTAYNVSSMEDIGNSWSLC